MSESLETESTTYSGIGAELYAARLRAGLELADISQRLRIRRQHLESIERGAFDEIPGRIYAIGFLRTYAEFLGFDGDDIISRFKAETGGGAAPAKLVFPSPAPESRMPGSAIILVALVLAAAAYGAWYYMHDIQRIATELVAEVPERLTTETGVAGGEGMATSMADETAKPATAMPMATNTASDTTATAEKPMAAEQPAATEEAQTAAAEPTPVTERQPETIAEQQAPVAEPEPATTASREQESVARPAAAAQDTSADESTAEPAAEPSTDTEPATERMAALPSPSQPVTVDGLTPAAIGRAAETATGGPVTVEQAPPPPPTVPASQPFNDSDAPQQYGIGNTDARVVLRARYDCWVQVRGANDEQFLTKVLRAGDTYHVPNRADVRLYASDAGALEVLVDGHTIPPIGGPGEIVRDVSLEAKMLLHRG